MKHPIRKLKRGGGRSNSQACDIVEASSAKADAVAAPFCQTIQKTRQFPTVEKAIISEVVNSPSIHTINNWIRYESEL